MHREGHVGMALLAYSPLGALVVALEYTGLAVVGAVAAGGLAMVPDLDMRVPFVQHRGPTHTVWFAGGLGVLAGIFGVVVGGAQGVLAGLGLGVFAALVVSMTIGSHLLADALTPTGIQPWRPTSKKTYTFDLVKAANPIANYGLLAIGFIAIVAAYVVGSAVAELPP